MNMSKKVIVVGAGIGGISAAYRLQKKGYDVVVYDRADFIGGRMKSVTHQGFNIDVGAGILPTAYVDTIELIKDAGLTDMMEMVKGNCAFPRDGKNHFISLGNMEWDMLKTKLLSFKTKFSMLKPSLQVMKHKSKLTYHNMGLSADIDTETVSDYCRREMPQEALDYIFGPFIRTMYLQPPEEASVAELFWCMKNLTGNSFSLKGGMDSLPKKLAEGLDVRLNTEVSEVKVVNGGVEVSIAEPSSEEQAGEQRVEQADYCIIAADARVTDKLYANGLSDRQREYLQTLGYSCDIVISLCLKSEPAIDATLAQVPESVDKELAAVVIDNKKGSGRVPPGKGMVTVHFLDSWGKRMFNEPDEKIIEEAIKSVSKVIPEVATELETCNIERWPLAATLSVPGTFKKLAGFMDDIDPNSQVQLSGDYMSLSSVNVSVATSKVAVENITNQGY